MLKVSELTGAQLDYWTARAEGVPAEQLSIRRVQWSTDFHAVHEGGRKTGSYSIGVLNYSTDWALGGPLIATRRISVEAMAAPVRWRADLFSRSVEAMGGEWAEEDGDTPLQAVCRAVVRAAFGDEVEEVRVTP